MLHNVREMVIEKYNKFMPDVVAIEDIIKYMPKKSSAQTTILLGIVNRTVGLAIYEMTNKPPELLNVMTIRHKLKFDKKLPPKEEMPDVVAKHLNVDFPYYTKTTKKGKTTILPHTYDVADAIAVGLAYIKIESSKSAK